jgi:hypothetical protein
LSPQPPGEAFTGLGAGTPSEAGRRGAQGIVIPIEPPHDLGLF